MQFEWDDAKSDACFIYRGLDFTYALRAFFDDGRVVTRDRRLGLRRGPLPAPRRHRGPGLRADLHGARFSHPHHFGSQGQQKGDSRV